MRFDLTPICLLPILRARRAEIAVIAVVCAVLVAGRWFPAGPWLLPFCFTGIWLAARIIRMPSDDRLWLACCCAGALILQIISFFLFGYHDPLQSNQQLDDHSYLVESRVISDTWHDGIYPDLHRKGSLPYLGTLHTGYHRILAFLFLFSPRAAVTGIILNIVFAALMPLLIYFSAAAIFDARDLRLMTGTISAANPRFPARMAALLGAIQPAIFYWCSFLLKDVILAALFVAAFMFLAEFLRTRNLISLAGCLLGVFFLAQMRAYAALSLAAGGVACALARMPFRWLMWCLFYLCMAVLIAHYTPQGQAYLLQLVDSLGAQLSHRLMSLRGVALWLAGGMPRLLLAPYAWVRAEGAHPMYGIYPGMWFLYLAIYPLAFLGFMLAIRANHLLTALPLVCILSVALLFLVAYGGDVARQRLYIEQIFIIYAGLGCAAPRKRPVFFAWYAILILFAAIQMLSLHLRHT